jgi:hypothetical protein
MAVIYSSIPAFLTAAATTITNAQTQATIAAALAALGYDAAVIQEGQTLLDTARALCDTQIREYGEQYAATQAFEAACQQADTTYAAHRNLAKIAFKTDLRRQTDLHLNDRKPRAFAPWYAQARHFYAAVLADPNAQTQLARYKITRDVLQAAQAQVEHAQTLKSAQEKEKGESQDATQRRDAALAALEVWLDDFKVVARIALADSPQLLESLTLSPRS